MGQWLLNPPQLPHSSLVSLKEPADHPSQGKPSMQMWYKHSHLGWDIEPSFLPWKWTWEAPAPPSPKADSRVYPLSPLLVSPARIWVFGFSYHLYPETILAHLGLEASLRTFTWGPSSGNHILIVSTDPSALNTICLFKPPLKGIFPWDSQFSVANAHHQHISFLPLVLTIRCIANRNKEVNLQRQTKFIPV